MKKGTSITLLTIISAFLAFLMFVTFVRFPVGYNKVGNYPGILGAIELGYGMEENISYTLELDIDSDTPEDMNEVLDIFGYRLQKLGYKDYSLKAVKNTDSNVYDVRLDINANKTKYISDYKEAQYDLATLDFDINSVIAYGKLEFYGGTSSNPQDKIFTDLATPIESVKYSGLDNNTGAHIVAIQFSKKAFAEMQEIFDEGDLYLTIKLGNDTLLDGSEALNEGYFQNRAIAMTTDSEATARRMVLQIESGGIDYEYVIADSSTSMIGGQTNGKIALLSVIAIAVVLVLAVVVFAILYKGFGLVSFMSLLSFILLDVAMFICIPGLKVTVGSVLGVLFASVLAIDGLAILVKRMSEEYASGKVVKTTIREGFRRSMIPTFTTGVIAGVVALALLFITNGQLNGFASAFGIGAVLATISSLLFSRLFIAIFLPLSKNKENFFKFKREDK